NTFQRRTIEHDVAADSAGGLASRRANVPHCALESVPYVTGPMAIGADEQAPEDATLCCALLRPALTGLHHPLRAQPCVSVDDGLMALDALMAVPADDTHVDGI